ncbi:hypothetical protein ACFLTK_04905 [Chloroflexota bacterium]
MKTANKGSDIRSFIDLDAGKILKGRSIAAVFDEVFQLLISVACGEKTASENWNSGEIAINRIAPTF